MEVVDIDNDYKDWTHLVNRKVDNRVNTNIVTPKASLKYERKRGRRAGGGRESQRGKLNEQAFRRMIINRSSPTNHTIEINKREERLCAFEILASSSCSFMSTIPFIIEMISIKNSSSHYSSSHHRVPSAIRIEVLSIPSRYEKKSIDAVIEAKMAMARDRIMSV